MLSKFLKSVLPFVLVCIVGATSGFASDGDLIVKEGKMDAPNGSIWYEKIYTKKTAHNTPLLILHGGPGVPHNYLSVLKKLASDRPVIFYDQLGCGNSTVLINDDSLWAIERFEADLEALVHHLHLKRFHLYGHSWGGALAVEYGLKHPQQLKSLTLASPLLSTSMWIQDAHKLMKKLPSDIQAAILQNEQQGTTNSKEYLNAVDVYYHHYVCRIKEWPSDLTYSFEHLSQDVYKTMWGPSEFTMTGNLKHFDRMQQLKNLPMPVLITGGKYDEATPATLVYAMKKIPHGKLIVYSNSAHLAFIEEEAKYLHDLAQALKDADK